MTEINSTSADAKRQKVWGTSGRLLGLWYEVTVASSDVKNHALSVFGRCGFSPIFLGLLTDWTVSLGLGGDPGGI